MVSCGGLLPGAGLPEEHTVTWFQFHSYLQRQGVSDLEKHFAQLTKEGRGWQGVVRTKDPLSWLRGSQSRRTTASFPCGCSFESPD